MRPTNKPREPQFMPKENMMNRALFAVLLPAFLVACATDFEPPKDGETAKLRIIAPQQPSSYDAIAARIYPTGKCENAMKFGSFGGVGGFGGNDSVLGMPGAETLIPGTFIERPISAGKRSLITIHTISGTKVCAVTFSILPQSGRNYEATLTLGSKSCRISANRIVIEHSGSVSKFPEDSLRQEETCRAGLS